jgi:hypothetical protein
MPSNVITAGSDARSARGWGEEVEACLPEVVVFLPWFEAEFEAVTPK